MARTYLLPALLALAACGQVAPPVREPVAPDKQTVAQGPLPVADSLRFVYHTDKAGLEGTLYNHHHRQVSFLSYSCDGMHENLLVNGRSGGVFCAAYLCNTNVLQTLTIAGGDSLAFKAGYCFSNPRPHRPRVVFAMRVPTGAAGDTTVNGVKMPHYVTLQLPGTPQSR